MLTRSHGGNSTPGSKPRVCICVCASANGYPTPLYPLQITFRDPVSGFACAPLFNPDPPSHLQVIEPLQPLYPRYVIALKEQTSQCREAAQVQGGYGGDVVTAQLEDLGMGRVEGRLRKGRGGGEGGGSMGRWEVCIVRTEQPPELTTLPQKMNSFFWIAAPSPFEKLTHNLLAYNTFHRTHHPNLGKLKT